MTRLVNQTLLNRYHVIEHIGGGTFAEVYKVWDSQRMTHLAMKVLRENMAIDRIFMRRFKREGQTLQKLQHPNIVRFYGLEQQGPIAFMLLDFIDGKTLKRQIFDSDGPLPVDKIRINMRAICGALQYAHSMGMVHCDIKSENIMIQESGSVLLTDFGISRMTDAATSTMIGIGTPAYMAPEQAQGLDPLPQSDIYGLGIVLYEMLTGGERPFTGEHAQITGTTSEKVRWEQVHRQPPSPRIYNQKISTQLEAVILKCLEKNPGDRYASGLELFNAFEWAMESGKTNATATVATTEELTKSQPTWECPICNQAVFNQLDVCPDCERQELEKVEETPVQKHKIRTWIWTAIIIVLITSLIAVIYRWPRFVPPASNLERLQQNAPITIQLSPIYFTSTRDSKREIYRLNNRQVERLTFTTGEGESWDPFISLSKLIYFTSNRDGKREIYRLKDKQVERLTFTSGEAESWDLFISLSGVIYFTSNRDGKREIYRLDNRQVERLTFTSGEAESWDPFISLSGVIYFTSNRDGKREIYRLKDKQVERLTFTHGGGESWNPFISLSEVIYFTSNRDGKREIYRLENRQVDRLTFTHGNGESWEPFISNSGVIYFTSNRDGKREIYRLQNKQVERLTFTPGKGESWEAWIR